MDGKGHHPVTPVSYLCTAGYGDLAAGDIVTFNDPELIPPLDRAAIKGGKLIPVDD